MAEAKRNAIRFAAFLRGINVGGNSLIKMEDLRTAFEAMGFRNVKTVLASGNVIFEAQVDEKTKLVRKIETGLKKKFGHEIGVMVRSIDELQDMVQSIPFQKTVMAPKVTMYVTFLAEEARDSTRITTESPEFRFVRISGFEAFSVHSPLPDSRGGDWMRIIEKQFGKKNTTRNWNTIIRILKA